MSQWKRKLQSQGEQIFSQDSQPSQKQQERKEAELYEQTGRLKMELEWLKKKLELSVNVKRQMIEPGNGELSIRRQCELLGLNRASYYYQAASESELNLKLMNWIDEQYTETPFYGWRRMTTYLRRVKEQAVNGKRVRRLMRLMGLQAIYPEPCKHKRATEHKIYPCLLRNLEIVEPNQVWSTDITYIRMSHGFMYLTAVIDWYSRYVLSWQLSNSLDNHFCLVALDQALAQATPAVFNTDQGVQFTAHSFTHRLLHSEVKISMDGRGRALDNIFVERLWRSVAPQNSVEMVLASNTSNGLYDI